ncbi:MAG: TetR/AcrR family transcriptional regulator [Oceanipulchritudo sp.]
MPRNRQQTEARIRGAGLELLRREGFEGWGVNAIARTAGVDKVLLYRYFGSLEGLLEQLVRETDFWPDPEDLPAHSPEAFIGATLERIADQPHIHALLAHPSARGPLSFIRRKFSDDLQRWLDGFRKLASGHIPEPHLERLPALIHFQAGTGRDGLSPRELWQQVSPPLEWRSGSGESWSANEELPTELL